MKPFQDNGHLGMSIDDLGDLRGDAIGSSPGDPLPQECLVVHLAADTLEETAKQMARGEAAVVRKMIREKLGFPCRQVEFGAQGEPEVSVGDVDPWWTTLEDELTPIEFDGSRTWILADDLDALQSPPETRGVRLLPPRDPYTQMRDRDTIVDRKHHREVWKPVGEPGAVLADGKIVGIWRPRKSGRKLTLTVKTFRSLSTKLRKQLREEADHVAELRGALSVQVEFETAAH